MTALRASSEGDEPVVPRETTGDAREPSEVLAAEPLAVAMPNFMTAVAAGASRSDAATVAAAQFIQDAQSRATQALRAHQLAGSGGTCASLVGREFLHAPITNERPVPRQDFAR